MHAGLIDIGIKFQHATNPERVAKSAIRNASKQMETNKAYTVHDMKQVKRGR
jgi:hypothetical protein